MNKKAGDKLSVQIRRLIRTILSPMPSFLKYSPKYHNLRRFLRESEFESIAFIKKWQLSKLKEIVEYSYKYVPGYHSLFNEAGVKPADIRALEDITLLPFTSKELIRDNLADFTSRKFSKWQLKYMTTGGSTGIPFGFYNTYDQYYTEYAFIHDGWSRFGWNIGDRSAVLRGAFVGNETDVSQYDKFSNELHLSSYYLTAQHYSNYARAIEKFKPHYLQAYPSSALILSDILDELDLKDSLKFKVLFLGSENLYAWQKTKILEAFPTSTICSWYGHAEKVILAMQCSENPSGHINPFYGLTELLNNKGNEVAKAEIGELTGTSFWNYATPFIRYKTMDYAQKGSDCCENCSRNYMLLDSIQGRLQEFIISSTGRYISMTSINMHDDIFDDLKQFRFVQEIEGRVIFKFIPKETANNLNFEELFKRLKAKLGDDIQLELSSVDFLPRNKSGKFSFLEQKLQLKYGE